mmetsp:Transcript_12449/g.22192  ORF Transcript_12449/g.22192 Transcript_12449/m.22192 type:complete len:87 (-) Transcript_12449:448-708(-)
MALNAGKVQCRRSIYVATIELLWIIAQVREQSACTCMTCLAGVMKRPSKIDIFPTLIVNFRKANMPRHVKKGFNYMIVPMTGGFMP